MGRVSLPEGVASANSKQSNDAECDPAVPDTATPDFATQSRREAHPVSSRLDPPHVESGRFYRFEDDDEDDDDRKEKRKSPSTDIVHGPHAPGPIVILVAIGLVLAALAAFVVARNQPEPLPLCSEQPDWNQYNCRAG